MSQFHMVRGEPIPNGTAKFLFDNVIVTYNLRPETTSGDAVVTSDCGIHDGVVWSDT